MSYALQPLLQQIRLAEKVATTEEQRHECRFFRDTLVQAEQARNTARVDFAQSDIAPPAAIAALEAIAALPAPDVGRTSYNALLTAYNEAREIARQALTAARPTTEANT